jgi:Cu(I)/Ag(I) efflux system periplasmic protein CusF
MKLRIYLTGVLMAFVLNPAPANAQSSDLIDGLVTKVDASAQKITIKHGPLKKFEMDDGMTMVFRAQDPAMLKTVKAGDKVKFVPDRINGQFTVTKIEKAR